MIFIFEGLGRWKRALEARKGVWEGRTIVQEGTKCGKEWSEGVQAEQVSCKQGILEGSEP
jgi:hypothetical protein